MNIEVLMPHLWELVQTDNPADKIDAATKLVSFAFTGKRRLGSILPMASHSIRVGYRLAAFGDDLTTVLVGILHDVIEDTDVTAELVASLFGAEVAKLTLACTLNPVLEKLDERRANLDLMKRTTDHGPRTVKVKVLDSTDSLTTLHQVPEEWRAEMLWCGQQWWKISCRVLGEHMPHTGALYSELIRLRAVPQ